MMFWSQVLAGKINSCMSRGDGGFKPQHAGGAEAAVELALFLTQRSKCFMIHVFLMAVGSYQR
jgi:hypothetical protein